MHDEAVDALELIVDEGRPANAGRFFQLGNDLLILLDELSDVPVAWRITHLKTGSAHATLAPPSNSPREGRVLRLAVASLGAVQGGAGFSDEWTAEAIRVAHSFVDHGRSAADEKDWVPPRLVLITDDFEPQPPSVDLTPPSASGWRTYSPLSAPCLGQCVGNSWGSMCLAATARRCACRTGGSCARGFDASLRADLRDAMYQQVELSGPVRQDGDGRVFHVRAETVRVLAKSKARWADLFGIDPDYLGSALAA